MTDLFANHPPPGTTLDYTERTIAALQERLARIEHDLAHCKYLTADRKWQLQQERYDKRKQLELLQSRLDRGLV